MALLRFNCEEYTSHSSVLVEVPDGMVDAYAGEIEVPCPDCNVKMECVH